MMIFQKFTLKKSLGALTLILISIFNETDMPQISDESKFLCESDITLEDAKEAINSLANNKTPGPDGIPSKFYKTFCTEIGNEL